MTAHENESRPEKSGNDQSVSDIQAVYDEIATHFSKTRAYPWPEVESFLDSQSATQGIDIGCGNGRHTTLLAESCERAVGLDVSRSLLTEAVKKYPATVASGGLQFIQGDAASLPVGTRSFQTVIYIATVHHLPTRNQRVASLREVERVLTADGVGLVSAWSTTHDRFDGDSEADTGFDTMVDWTLPGGETVPRYYHIYAPAEFRLDIERAGLTIQSFEISSGNCYVTVKTRD